VDAADRPVKTYSGGMRRRVDLAMSLIAEPPILFLDEPTTGLDPRSRLGMWEIIRQLVADGTTILLTTQYLEEADQLANKIAVIDHGKVIAEGTSDELKRKVGGERLELTISKKSDFEAAVAAIDGKSTKSDPRRRTISMAAKQGVDQLKQALDKLEKSGVKVEGVSLHRPTLDDVFLSLTGHKATAAEKADKKAKAKKKKRKKS
jgi:ABC-2 type transport system ATP-binding protein